MTSTPAIIGVEQQPGLGRAVALDDLQVERQVGDRAEEREADDEADRARDREDPVAEELERQDRLRGAPLDERERDEQHDAEHRPARRSGGEPQAYVVPPRLVKSTIAGEPAGEQRRAEVVDRVADVRGARVERGRDHGERERPPSGRLM